MEVLTPDIVIAEKEFYTIQEYLDMEETSVEKHQFHQGKISVMPGGTYNHNLISVNVTAEIRNALIANNSDADVISSDMKINVPARERFFYADGSVVMGESEFYDGNSSALENSTLIIEVASDSTELFDRTGKFEAYNTLPSFKEYVLVSQKQPLVEVWTWRDTNSWSVKICRNLTDTVYFETIDCSISMAQIYQRVKF